MRNFQAIMACVVVLGNALTLGQNNPTRPAGANRTSSASGRAFDAASVRPSTQEFVLKGVDFLNPASDAAPPKGGLFSWNVTLPWLINFAYDLRSAQERREAREALPKWAQEQWYEVEARAEGNPTRDDVCKMVRSLLEERFEFAGHFGQRVRQAYTLTVATQGLKIKLHPEGAPCTLSPSEIDKYPQVSPAYNAVPAHCGFLARELGRSGERRLEMLDMSVQQIGDSLGLGLPLSVIDRTGLTGNYDAVLDFAPDDIPSDKVSADEIGLPPLRVAIEKQLGLKLAKQNVQVNVFVVDHIGQLSGN